MRAFSPSPSMRRSTGPPTAPRPPGADSGVALAAEEPARFLPDTQCTTCHAELAKDFPSIGMARSFGVPEPGSPVVEDWTRATFEHALSGDRYRFARRDDSRLWFERWQVDASGREIHRLEIPIDFVLGSGNRSRVYLYRTPSGELFQLPLAWYAQERSFAMAPGYDRRDHDGIGRRVRRECMFCHTANPETATTLVSGWDARHAPQTFPGELPHGIGCQRCHGPGSRHATLGVERRRHHRRGACRDRQSGPTRTAASTRRLLPVPPATGGGAARPSPSRQERLRVPPRREAVGLDPRGARGPRRECRGAADRR